MKKFALLACALLFVSSAAFAEVNTTLADAAREAAKKGTNTTFTFAGVGYTVLVGAAVLTITNQNSGTTSTVAK